jgi:hypothetical protein
MNIPEKLATLGTYDTGQINVRKYRWGNQEWTIQRNWQHWVRKIQDEEKQTQRNMLWTSVYTNTNTNNINETWALLQTTGGKDEPNIILFGTKNAKIHNRTTQIRHATRTQTKNACELMCSWRVSSSCFLMVNNWGFSS